MSEKKRGFLWHLLAAIISVLSIIVIFNFKDNIILVIGLCLVGFISSLYLNSYDGIGKGILKTLLFLLILLIIFFAIAYFSGPLEEYIFNVFVFSFILLPSLSFMGKLLSIILDLLVLV